MKIVRVLLALGSIGLTVGLLVLLVRVGNLDRHATLQLVRNANPIAFIKLVILNFFLVVISTKKWRCIDEGLRSPASSVPSVTESLAATSVGMALGLVIPVQLGMTTARTIGTYFHGHAFKRGMAGTIFEQAFDVLIVGLFAVISVLTRFLLGGGMLWVVFAVTIIGFAFSVSGPSVRLMNRLAAQAQSNLPRSGPLKFLLHGLDELQRAGVLQESLARRLASLSVIRFFIVVAMAGETAAAVGLQIPLWHFAAAVPFVFVATAIAITPGGLGVSELTSTTALSLFGTPLATAAQWSVANRILGTVACMLVAGCAITADAIQKQAGKYGSQVSSSVPEQG